MIVLMFDRTTGYSYKTVSNRNKACFIVSLFIHLASILTRRRNVLKAVLLYCLFD